MANRPAGYRGVQPEWREKVLKSLSSTAEWSEWDPATLAGTENDWAEGEGEDFDEFEDWLADRKDWLRIALKELQFLGHIETKSRPGLLTPLIRLTEAGAVFLHELNKPKAVAA